MKNIMCIGIAACALLVANVSSADEFSVEAGKTIANSIEDQQGVAWALEYRQPFFSPRVDATILWMNEGHPRNFPKRDGIAGELWWHLRPNDDTDRLKLTLGTGPYAYWATESTGGSGYRDRHGVAWLVSFDASYRMTRDTALHVTFHRVTTGNSTDTDVLLLGIGYTM
ncbi:MAG: hypothetical protein ACYCZZ_00615 [Minisyncoccota bacterium]